VCSPPCRYNNHLVRTPRLLLFFTPCFGGDHSVFHFLRRLFGSFGFCRRICSVLPLSAAAVASVRPLSRDMSHSPQPLPRGMLRILPCQADHRFMTGLGTAIIRNGTGPLPQRCCGASRLCAAGGRAEVRESRDRDQWTHQNALHAVARHTDRCGSSGPARNPRPATRAPSRDRVSADASCRCSSSPSANRAYWLSRSLSRLARLQRLSRTTGSFVAPPRPTRHLSEITSQTAKPAPTASHRRTTLRNRRIWYLARLCNRLYYSIVPVWSRYLLSIVRSTRFRLPSLPPPPSFPRASRQLSISDFLHRLCINRRFPTQFFAFPTDRNYARRRAVRFRASPHQTRATARSS
jgi:hypothetical protein